MENKWRNKVEASVQTETNEKIHGLNISLSPSHRLAHKIQIQWEVWNENTYFLLLCDNFSIQEDKACDWRRTTNSNLSVVVVVVAEQVLEESKKVTLIPTLDSDPNPDSIAAVFSKCNLHVMLILDDDEQKRERERRRWKERRLRRKGRRSFPDFGFLSLIQQEERKKDIAAHRFLLLVLLLLFLCLVSVSQLPSNSLLCFCCQVLQDFIPTDCLSPALLIPRLCVVCSSTYHCSLESSVSQTVSSPGKRYREESYLTCRGSARRNWKAKTFSFDSVQKVHSSGKIVFFYFVTVGILPHLSFAQITDITIISSFNTLSFRRFLTSSLFVVPSFVFYLVPSNPTQTSFIGVWQPRFVIVLRLLRHPEFALFYIKLRQ